MLNDPDSWMLISLRYVGFRIKGVRTEWPAPLCGTWHVGGVEILRIFGKMSVFLFKQSLHNSEFSSFKSLKDRNWSTTCWFFGDYSCKPRCTQLGSYHATRPQDAGWSPPKKNMTVSKIGNSNPNLYCLVMKAVMKMAWMSHFFSIPKWREVRDGLHPGSFFAKFASWVILLRNPRKLGNRFGSVG